MRCLHIHITKESTGSWSFKNMDILIFWGWIIYVYTKLAASMYESIHVMKQADILCFLIKNNCFEMISIAKCPCVNSHTHLRLPLHLQHHLHQPVWLERSLPREHSFSAVWSQPSWVLEVLGLVLDHLLAAMPEAESIIYGMLAQFANKWLRVRVYVYI